MSGRLVGEVLDHAPLDLTLLERLVLIALAETARDTDRTARYKASADAIADRIGSTPGSVRNTLGSLKARALIAPLHEKPRRGKSQEWRLTKLTAASRRATWESVTGE